MRCHVVCDYETEELSVYSVCISAGKTYKITIAKDGLASFVAGFEVDRDVGVQSLSYQEFTSILSVMADQLWKLALQQCLEHGRFSVKFVIIQFDKDPQRRVRFYKKASDRFLRSLIKKDPNKIRLAKTEVINNAIRIFMERM